ncbi:MAG: four helix bundle protein [Nonlabens sp.]
MKEAEEVEYWLDIIDETRNYDLKHLYSQVDEVIRLLVSIIKKSSNNS